ncbi:ribonuclease H-like domain-containing protein [Tanacetum coccineum]
MASDEEQLVTSVETPQMVSTIKMHVLKKEGLNKAYDRFQILISQLEVHGAPVSNEDANHKFLRALPLAWSNITLIMRNGDKLDTLDLDDLYNNLKVYEANIKGSSGSFSNSHNLDSEDLEQIDNDDIEEMDLKWQEAANGRDVADGIGYGWSYMAEEEPTDFAFMAYTSSNSGSDFEVKSYSTQCEKSYKNHQKQYEEQREHLNKSNIEIIAYQLGLESVEKQLVVYQKNEDVYEEMVGVLEFGVKEKENAIIRLENSYGDQMNENEFNGSKVDKNVSESMFDSRLSDGYDIQANDRLKKLDGYHAVPPPLTGNYIPPKGDLSFAGLDDSVYKCKVSESIANESKVETNVTKTSTNSVEKPKTDRLSAPLIEEWDSDSDDESSFRPISDQPKHTPVKINYVKPIECVERDKQAEKHRKLTQSPKVDRKDWNGLMAKKLRQRELKAKSILLLALPDEHQLKFHRIEDAKHFQLEVHGALVSNEDANHKFLRALPLAWSNIALIMRNDDKLDTLDLDDLYNNLKVYEANIKGSSGSFSNSHNVAFLSSKNASSTNEAFNTDNDDFQPIQQSIVKMIIIRVKRFYNKTRRKVSFNSKDTVGFDKSKVDFFNCHRRGHFARECRAPKNQGNRSSNGGDSSGYRGRDNNRRSVPIETSNAMVVQDKALIVQDGIGYDWSYMAEEELTDFAFMAFTSSNSSSDSELDKILKEKEYLNAKLEKFETSSKNLTKLLNSQLSAKDKTSLGYGDQMNENEFNGSKVDKNVSESMFDSRSSDGYDIHANDRLKKLDGYHAVPPPLTRNYIPPKADLFFAGLDDSVYKCKVSESIANESKVETNVTKTSTNSVEKPKTDRLSAPLIEEWDNDSDDESSFRPISDQPKHTPININYVKPVECVKCVERDKQAEKPRKLTQSPKVDRKDWNGLMAKKLSAAKRSSPRVAVSTSPNRPVNTATPKKSVNVSNLRRNTFHKLHLPIRWSFYRSTTPKTNISKEKVNIVRVNSVNTACQKAVSAVEGKGNIVLKASACCTWRPKMTTLEHVSNDNSGS